MFQQKEKEAYLSILMDTKIVLRFLSPLRLGDGGLIAWDNRQNKFNCRRGPIQ